MAIYKEKAHTLDDLENEEKQNAENLTNDLEGQRVFLPHHYEFWMISAIAFCWSIFQLYIVVEPINSTISRSVHLSFAIVLAFLSSLCLKNPTF